MTNSKNYFVQKTNLFCLEADLDDEKLIIVFRDYAGWFLYERAYTSANFTKSSGITMDLQHIYTALKEGKPQNHKEPFGLVQYNFGEVLAKDGIPCYKVEQDGKIEVFQCALDKITGKDMINSQVLALDLVREMTEKEIFEIKLEHDTFKIKKQLRKGTELDKESLQNEMKTQIKSLMLSVNQVQRKNEKKTQDLAAENNRLKLQVQNLKKKTICINNLYLPVPLFSIILLLVFILATSLSYYFSSSSQTRVMTKLKEMNVYQDGIFSIYDQPYRNKFSIVGNKLEYIGAAQKYTQFIFDKKIPMKGEFSFKIKIVETKLREIMIGVVDYEKQKKQRSSFGSKNAVVYSGYEEIIYPSGVRQGPGFKKGDIITVKINRQDFKIHWGIDHFGVNAESHQILGNKARDLRPYVEMNSPEDAIEWLQD